jgi:ferrochelatase
LRLFVIASRHASSTSAAAFFVTPAFVADCLETLEEIAMEAKHQFMEHGGENFLAIPCMNDGDEWCGVMGNWIEEWSK